MQGEEVSLCAGDMTHIQKTLRMPPLSELLSELSEAAGYTPAYRVCSAFLYTDKTLKKEPKKNTPIYNSIQKVKILRSNLLRR